MSVTNNTIGLLAKEFEGGGGPSHSMIENIWMTADADRYLPPEQYPDGSKNNKQKRVLKGLKNLRDGFRDGTSSFNSDPEKLREVVQGIANELNLDFTSKNRLVLALIDDGFSLSGSGAVVGNTEDSPTSRLADYLEELFDEDEVYEIARNHYAQAMSAFDRAHWESANAQFRSAFEATFDALASMNDCPTNKKGGAARKWLQDEGLLDKGEAGLVQSFGSFASDAGSHAGISDRSECQLRRHFVTALMVYGIEKLGE